LREQIGQLLRYLTAELAYPPQSPGRPLVNDIPSTFNPINKTMSCVMGGT